MSLVLVNFVILVDFCPCPRGCLRVRTNSCGTSFGVHELRPSPATRVGRLGVSNLRLKCQALSFSLLVSVVSDPEDSCFFFLCKYFVGRHLASAQAE